ncbi:MAG TPA: transporter substrate-binding domain-containing protein [Burkholderiaceae bacterium]|jgi:polar amino acid transport system substrate-binding protein
MNKFLARLLFLLTISSCAAAGSDKTIAFASTEFPPFYGADLPNQGVLTDITVRAFKRMGYRVSVQFLPFARTLSYGKEGSVDGVIALWYSEERAQWFVFSEPLAPNLVGFYKRKRDTIHFNSLQDLTPYRIGTVSGYANPPAFDAAHLTVDAVPSDETNLKKLYAGHIDLALIDQVVARYLIKTKYPEFADALEWMGPALEVRPQYIAFSKKSQNYLTYQKDFSAGLKKLSASGELQSILRQYGMKN